MEEIDEHTAFSLIDISDKLQVVNSKDTEKLKVHEFCYDADIIDIISHFLELKSSDDPFYIVDIHEVYKKYQQWVTLLPRVTPFYAIKSNPDPIVVNLLAKLGCGFDAASKDEIILAKSTCVLDEKILYANPCKNMDGLQYARSQDVDYLTFDSRCELDKIKVFHPDAKCILRIKVDDSGSECQFSSKFGATLEEARDLLALAQLDELDIVGTSFHQGSNCRVLGQFDKAICDARKIFDMAKEYGFNMNILDLGGGYPSNDDAVITFPQLAEEINNAIDKYFSDISNLKIIAEPGRFMCATSHTLVVTIIGIKSSKNLITDEKEFKYTINDTVYGSFNCIVFDHASPIIYPFNERTEKTYKSTIFGCSCDSLDVITKPGALDLPKLSVGDRCFVQNFGSYTRSSSSSV